MGRPVGATWGWLAGPIVIKALAGALVGVAILVIAVAVSRLIGA